MNQDTASIHSEPGHPYSGTQWGGQGKPGLNKGGIQAKKKAGKLILDTNSMLS